MNNGDTLENFERERVFNLSDEQLLLIIRGRGNELSIARTLGSLVRLFETGIERSPELTPGLNAAINLTKLFSQRFAPGHTAHPFKNFAVQTVVRVPVEARTEAPIPKPAEPSQEASAPAVVALPKISKTARVCGIILNSPLRSFASAAALRKECDFPEEFTITDIHNGIMSLINRKQLQRTPDGGLQKL